MVFVEASGAHQPHAGERTLQQGAQDSINRDAAAARYEGRGRAMIDSHREELAVSAVAADAIRDQLRDMQIIPPHNKATLIGEESGILRRVHMHPGLVDQTKKGAA